MNPDFKQENSRRFIDTEEERYRRVQGCETVQDLLNILSILGLKDTGGQTAIILAIAQGIKNPEGLRLHNLNDVTEEYGIRQKLESLLSKQPL